jgi:hypothetical protein
VLGLLISKVQYIYVLIFTKNGLGYIFGPFFTMSSGHPGDQIVQIIANWAIFESYRSAQNFGLLSSTEKLL